MASPDAGSRPSLDGAAGSEGLHTPPPAARTAEELYLDASDEGNESGEEFVRDPEFEAGIVLSPPPATPTEPSPVVSPARETRIPRRVGPNVQNMFVVRHGERSDDAIPGWEKTAARPWDPPLTEKGFQQAYNVGQQLRNEGYKIDRVVISPFLRCLQTAGEIIKALMDGGGEDETVKDSKGKGVERAQDGTARGPASKVKAHIDYGLTELLNARAIRNLPRSGADLHSKDTWLLPEEQLHALLPPGVLDESLGTQGTFPDWPEDDKVCHARYADTYNRVGDQFPNEDIICVTHGEGVGVSASRFKRVVVYAVNYCGFTQAQRARPGTSGESDEHWELVTQSEESGVYWTMTT
eukprot:TRINITY_DN504_c0_g1_i1.p1 TRINITY_DN504_c0_g1~~TRINITY_DN504_c0_g1_i1.p1  ORF type:complete len:353 (+),score=47.91 TRINITY_DN504_c0_g1_i1:32-1090(+)